MFIAPVVPRRAAAPFILIIGHAARGICHIPKGAKALPLAADKTSMSPISPVAASTGLPSAQSSGLAALATSNRQLNQDAQQIANPDNQNVTNPLLDLNQAKLLTEAGADILRTSNQMLGSLFDMFA
jgi:hypothetical protein